MYSDYSDINQARNHQASLKDLVQRHPGSGADWRALRRALALCKAATDAIDDDYCRAKLNSVTEYTGELFARSAGERRDLLKQLILEALELYGSRLYRIEMTRMGVPSLLTRTPRMAHMGL